MRMGSFSWQLHPIQTHKNSTVHKIMSKSLIIMRSGLNQNKSAYSAAIREIYSIYGQNNSILQNTLVSIILF